MDGKGMTAVDLMPGYRKEENKFREELRLVKEKHENEINEEELSHRSVE